MRNAYAAAVAGMLAIAACVPAASGQDVAQRIKQVDNGTVNLIFASKPGVCGDGETYISTGGEDELGHHTNFIQNRSGWSVSSGSGDYRWRNCNPGPVQVALRVERGQVVDLDTYVGGRPPAGALFAGTRAAVDYLLRLAETAETAVGKHALLPVVLADSVQPWAQMLQLARNGSVSHEVRKATIFWLSQAAGDKAVEGLKSLLSDDDVEIRKQVVFALSQLRDDQGVDALIDVARTGKDPAVRKSAFFWLSQKNDPRVLALFEEVLLKK